MAHGGFPIMGLKSYAAPWCLVSSDRPLADAQDSITSIGFSLADVPIVPAFGAHKKNVPQIMDAVNKLGAKFILWEGIDMCVSNANSGGEVAEFLSRVTAYCEAGLTILGTTGVAKLKPHEVYANPRQLVSGSSVWERATSSDLVIQPINPWDPGCPDRLLYCTLKQEPSFSVAGKFDDRGILVFDNWTERHIGAKVAQLIGKKGEVENIKRIITSDRFFSPNSR